MIYWIGPTIGAIASFYIYPKLKEFAYKPSMFYDTKSLVTFTVNDNLISSPVSAIFLIGLKIKD